AAELGDGVVGEVGGGFRVRDVHVMERRRTALSADRVRHGFAAFGVDVGEDDPRPLTGQAARVRLADPLRRAGDDGGPAFETCHGASPVLVVDGPGRVRAPGACCGHAGYATALVSRYSSNPATPISRPIPDCL